MFNNSFYRAQKISPRGFRYRGNDSTRLEQLTDGVFAFAITMLVISSQVPQTYLELSASMYSFSGFVFCIMLVLGIWNNHRNFFLHYGLEDKRVRVLNFLLFFILLYYIYPLKFLFGYIGTSLYVRVKLMLGDRSEELILALDKLENASMEASQWEDLMIRFGIGLFCIYLIFFLLHRYALKNKTALELDDFETYETKTFIQAYTILVSITIVSMAVVLIFGGDAAGLSGGVYLLIPILLAVHRKYRNGRSPFSEHAKLS